MTEEKKTVLMIGAGLSSTSLALALIEKGFKDPIRIFEQTPTVMVNKTWCFWYPENLPSYLKPLIAKKWSHWQLSLEQATFEQTSMDDSNHYCCIKAEDFYQFAHERLHKVGNVIHLYNQNCHILPPHDEFVRVQHNNEITSGKYGFNSHCVLPDELEDGLYQCFVGAWICLKEPHFKSNTAGLMLNLNVCDKNIQFDYVLPFSDTHGLWELTYFSPQKADLNVMQEQVLATLDAKFGLNKFSVKSWERGILPMSNSLGKVTYDQNGWHNIGIAGGMIRASTGYAFLPIQRWCQTAAIALMRGDKILQCKYAAVPKRYQTLDKIFLKVLRVNPDLAPQLFIQMIKGTTSKQFTNFMTEQANPYDIAMVIRVMPKIPFLQALL